MILSRLIKQQKSRRILVCGDSFFMDAGQRFPYLHWSQRLPDYLEVTNVACGGASNTMVLDQFIEHYNSHDIVIFGFTGLWRLEFHLGKRKSLVDGKWATSCHTTHLNPEQIKLGDDYRKLICVDAAIVRECGLMISAIELARKSALVFYSLGGGRSWMQDLCNDYPSNTTIRTYLRDEMSFNLYDYFMSSEYDQHRHLDGTDSHPPFHIHLPEIQQRFADQVRDLVDNA